VGRRVGRLKNKVKTGKGLRTKRKLFGPSCTREHGLRIGGYSAKGGWSRGENSWRTGKEINAKNDTGPEEKRQEKKNGCGRLTWANNGRRGGTTN